LKILAEIQDHLLSVVERVNNISDSLQREFEWYLKSSVGEKTLQAKKNQQKEINDLKKANADLMTKFDKVDAYIYALQACLLCHGVSPADIDNFALREKRHIKYDLDELTQSNVVEIPAKIQLMLNLIDPDRSIWDNLNSDLAIAERQKAKENKGELPTQPRYATAPVYDWNQIAIAKGKA
jgi:hypothetical protein